MHTAATAGVDGSVGSGRRAFAHSARTLPGVSAPSSVVRSTHRIARSSAHTLAAFLMLRVASPAARPSAPTWSTPGSPCRNRRSVASSRTTSDRKSTRLNSSHLGISYAVFCLKKKKNKQHHLPVKQNNKNNNHTYVPF